MTALGTAILEAVREMAPDQRAELLELLGGGAPAVPESRPDRWLSAREAAEYVGLTVAALHKHTSARAIPFEQERPGAKLWFRAEELDAWRRGQAERASTSLLRVVN